LPHCTGEGPHMVHLQSRMTKFGRGEGNHVPLRSSKTPQMLSRNHAVILQESSRCLLVDQGSLNGVLLNGVRVYGEQPLKPGDVLTFGVTTPEPEFDYVLEERPAS
jgi:pSer/pThr/pTyr-binding forkhead associated (FHA) protein